MCMFSFLLSLFRWCVLNRRHLVHVTIHTEFMVILIKLLGGAQIHYRERESNGVARSLRLERWCHPFFFHRLEFHQCVSVPYVSPPNSVRIVWSGVLLTFENKSYSLVNLGGEIHLYDGLSVKFYECVCKVKRNCVSFNDRCVLVVF